MAKEWPPGSRRARRRASADYERRRQERLVERIDVTLQCARVVSASIERATERLARTAGDG